MRHGRVVCERATATQQLFIAWCEPARTETMCVTDGGICVCPIRGGVCGALGTRSVDLWPRLAGEGASQGRVGAESAVAQARAGEGASESAVSESGVFARNFGRGYRDA